MPSGNAESRKIFLRLPRRSTINRRSLCPPPPWIYRNFCMVQGPVPPEITPPLPSSFVPPPAGHSSAVSATLSPTTPRTRIRMAPMSPTYDRLEAGRPLKHSRRFAWKKFAIGAGILLALVWLFVPKENRQISMPGWGGSPEFEKGNTPYEGKPSGPAEGNPSHRCAWDPIARFDLLNVELGLVSSRRPEAQLCQHVVRRREGVVVLSYAFRHLLEYGTKAGTIAVDVRMAKETLRRFFSLLFFELPYGDPEVALGGPLLLFYCFRGCVRVAIRISIHPGWNKNKTIATSCGLVNDSGHIREANALEPPPSRPNHADEDPAHPTSFETDPDPTKTTYCKSPHPSADRLVQYALMLDAGSTGSRIHVYKFNNCGPLPEYEYETFKMTPKEAGGLSAYAGRPLAAAASLNILMDEAMRVVPLSLRKCTPVAVKATAGLRLLPGSQSADILGAVMDHLRDAYPFALPAKASDAVAIMDGADEGVFAWVTANYLLGPVRADATPDTPTFAVLDLGGGSTQIVFAPKEGAPLHEGEHKYDLDFGGRRRVLYQHSYLGYGLMSARASVHRVVEFMASLHEGPPAPKSASGVSTISNPCLARGTQRTVELVADGGVKKNVTMDGADVGGFAACMKIVNLVLAKDAVCAVRPCAFGGVYQPALSEAFPPSAGRVLLLSYFYDRVAPLVPEPVGGQLTATVEAVAELAKVVCAGRDTWLTHANWGTQPELMEDLEGRPEWCLDLTFMYGLLRTGYEFDGDREVMFGKQIAGTELGWCLGAGIKLVGGVDVQCRI
ncbi:nucleoside phosphatase family-domain-containing protein [Mycena alexandri]|uniref:guanosine-diphosphatase n=1 Tax=Mycena alexandri TaxID=1745969 RepID=A0AAD6WV32_9AGAR|nr:nucleoside phosphatase family-domain-containing protein [Mycena alexandri]